MLVGGQMQTVFADAPAGSKFWSYPRLRIQNLVADVIYLRNGESSSWGESPCPPRVWGTESARGGTVSNMRSGFASGLYRPYDHMEHAMWQDYN